MKHRPALAFAALLLLIGVPMVVSPWFGWGSRPGEAVSLTVPPGASLGAVVAELDKAGLIDAQRQFRILARLFGDDAPVQAGRYALRKGDAWRTYLEMMQQGKVVRLLVTIPEGMPSVLIAEKLAAEKRLSGPVKTPVEGSVLAETYEFSEGEPREAVLGRMQAAMLSALSELWPRRTAATAVSSPRETIILASIVEKETGKASERRRIAGVYSNRLRQGMKLDADPTVIYPITKGKPLGRRIRRSELNADTGYNTYLKPGLPVGAIANPGRDSLAAVLDPEVHKYLYFVADGTGGHVFAASYAEHQANVAKWYALRRSRGEM